MGLLMLVYYALTNLSARRQTDADQFYPRWISWTGLIVCMGLAVFVEQRIWLAGLGMIGIRWYVVERVIAMRRCSL